jgi:hypothetical protein
MDIAESCKSAALPAQKRSILYQKLCSALELAALNCSYGDYLVDERNSNLRVSSAR